LLLVSIFSAKWRTSWVLVIPEAMNPPVNQCLNCSRGCILYHEHCGKEVFSAAIHAVFYNLGSEIALKIGFFSPAGAKSPC
jgi:hypothetical protein